MAMRIEIIGHLGHDSEVREKDGRQWLSFDVAPSQGKDKDGNGTIWVSCLYGNVKLQQWLVKGRQVFLRGDYRDRLFTKRDGTVGIDRSVFVNEIELLGGGGNAENNPLTQQRPQQTQGYQHPNYNNAPNPAPQGQPAQQGWQFPSAPLTQPQWQPKAVSLEEDDGDLPF